MTCKLQIRELLICVFSLSLVACNDNAIKTVDDDASNDSIIVATPRGILQARAIVQENLSVEVIVNGESLTSTQDGDMSTVSATIDQGEQLIIEVSWFELFENRMLPLASLTEVIPAIQDGEQIQLSADDYETAQFDEDNDSLSNLFERQNGTDPFDARNINPDDSPTNDPDPVDPMPEIPPLDVSIPNPNPNQNCGLAAGDDAISGDDDWSNNCELGRRGPHANSNYTRGVQRIIGCTGVADGDDARDDAQFGPSTQRAVEAYQQSRNLRVDGFVGPLTWGALRGELERVASESTSTHVIETWEVGGSGCDGQSQFFRNTDRLSGAFVNWGMARSPGDGIGGQVEFSVLNPRN